MPGAGVHPHTGTGHRRSPPAHAEPLRITAADRQPHPAAVQFPTRGPDGGPFASAGEPRPPTPSRARSPAPHARSRTRPPVCLTQRQPAGTPAFPGPVRYGTMLATHPA
ncbi:hypothetical protein GCM10018793_18580 [Streptomyces sulfonofaciens]|uniref:Uncharacterized protein n=1 Tax=Streptomyces sulfonofaciens TaxID=68272 RepID=A0A919G0M6_9ACTN|nr:hypothetical protein GCM10018793_18580 [Streptomyces sulfonofaciens]